MHKLMYRVCILVAIFIGLSALYTYINRPVSAQHTCSCPCGCDGSGACAVCEPGKNTDIRARAYLIDALGRYWSRSCTFPFIGADIVGNSGNVLTTTEVCSPGDDHFNLRTREGTGGTAYYNVTGFTPCTNVSWEVQDNNNSNVVVRSGIGCNGELIIASKHEQNRYTLVFRMTGPIIPPPPPVCIGSPISAPTNVRSTCTWGEEMEISWDPDPDASYYSLRINSSLDNFDWQPGGPCPAAITGPGDHCVDIPAGQTSYKFPVDPYATYSWWIHSRDSCDNWGLPAVLGPANKCVPNCFNMNAPASIQVGQSGVLSADFVSLDGSLIGQIYRGNFSPLVSSAFPDTSAQMTTTWTPTAADVGSHQVCCRAFNDSKTECRPPAQVDGSPRYNCLGSTGTGVDTCTIVDIIEPSPWFKLKDASFHRNGTFNITIPSNMDKFDGADDTDDQYPIIGHAGVLSTTENTLTVNSLSGDVSALRWRATNFADQNSFLDNIDAFIAYARARKNVNLITGLADIQPNVINILQGDVTIADYNELPSRVRDASYILIVNGDLTFGWVPPEININQHGVAFIATGKINIDSRYTEINGILIAQSIDLASDVVPPNTATNPLKINGNLISRTAIDTNKRARTDTNRPSLFVVFKPQMYAELLPLLSTITQEGRQIE